MILPNGDFKYARFHASSTIDIILSDHGLGPSHSVNGMRPSLTYSADPKIISEIMVSLFAKPFFENEYVSGNDPNLDVSLISVLSISAIFPVNSS